MNFLAGPNKSKPHNFFLHVKWKTPQCPSYIINTGDTASQSSNLSVIGEVFRDITKLTRSNFRDPT